MACGFPVGGGCMEYKLSSFQFSPGVSREDKHHAITVINGIRSKCPSDSNFTGAFQSDDSTKMFTGEIKVLFSKGQFSVSHSSTSMGGLMKTLIRELEDQIAAWKEVRFEQPETFINYFEWLSKQNATGS